jgi:hypothetical protein
MPTKLGGKANAAYYVTEEQLDIFPLEGGFIATPVYGVELNDPTEGGNLLPVYSIESTDLIENGGRFRLAKGTPIPINTFITNRKVVRGRATPVYIVNGDTGRVGIIGPPTTNENTGTDLELFVPDNLEVGDYMVAEVRYAGSSGAEITKPITAVWTTVYEAYASGLWMGIYSKFAVLADTDPNTSYTWEFDESADSSGGMSGYRCVNTVAPVNAVGPGNSGNSNRPNGKSVTPSVEGTRILYFVGAAGDVTHVPPTGFVETTDTPNGNASGGSGGKGKKDKTPTGDQTGTTNTTVTWQTVMVAIAPCDSVTLPAPPTNLAISATSPFTITLTWTDQSTNETLFSLERSLDGIAFVEVATPASNAVTYQDTGLDLGTTYYYRLRALNGTGYSQYSDIVSGDTTTGSAINFGTFEYWQGGLLPPGAPNGIDSGNFEYWQGGLLPPVFTVV